MYVSQALLDNSKVKVLAFFIDISYNIDAQNERSDCMKRFLPVLMCLCMILCSCAHKDHTYSQSWSYDTEAHWIACKHSECDTTVARATHSFAVSFDGTLVCNVCSYSKSKENEATPHTHTPTGEYVMSSSHHWRACEGCNERLDEQEHTWGERYVTVPPTSDTEGIAERYCTVCDKFSTVTLDTIVGKMSEENWRSSFELSNVRVTEWSKNGSLSSVNTMYDVDGNIVALYDSSSTAYKGRSILKNFDFSDYYDNFSYYGEGVYKSSGFHLESADRNYNIQNVVVTFNGSTIKSVSYSLKLTAFGYVGYEYSFSHWGEIRLDPKYFSSEILSSLILFDNFTDGFSLTYQKFDMSGKYIESQLTVTNGTYVCKNYQNNVYKGIQNGDSAIAIREISEHLYSILSPFDPATLVFEEDYDNYTYIGDGIDISGFGVVTACDVYVSDGHLQSVSIQIQDGSTYFYDFQYL